MPWNKPSSRCRSSPARPRPRAFLQELGGSRIQELAACGQRVGVPKETWALQQGPQGDLLVVNMAGEDTARALAGFAAS